jgi:hypothetical protein
MSLHAGLVQFINDLGNTALVKQATFPSGSLVEYAMIHNATLGSFHRHDIIIYLDDLAKSNSEGGYWVTNPLYAVHMPDGYFD